MKAYVLQRTGSGSLYKASMEKGDPETKAFAEEANRALKIGGITIVLSDKVTQAALREAAALIARNLNP